MKKIEQLSTLDRMMQNPDFKAKFEAGYQEFLLSELLISIMENDHISIAQLAEEVNISPAVIQDICSGQQKDMKISNFLQIVKSCGYRLILEKGEDRISLVA
ncbi:helix-turn-helix domain-containing protein [Anabaena sp. WFMT]|uniref:helix-turn-helix domain-containing protein n=1 Tax=Anabaena sp. WFMT TaxID=3449730 RepID=UPI003F1ECE03